MLFCIIALKRMKRKKNFLVINPGPSLKEFIFEELRMLKLNIYVASKTPAPALLLKYIQVNNIISCDNYNPQQLIPQIISFMKNKVTMFHGVITLCEESVYQTALIADFFNLAGISPEAALKSSVNKYLMRETCKKNSINMPRYFAFTSFTDGLEKYMKFSKATVIKPVNSADSQGVFKINIPRKKKCFKDAYNKMIGKLDSINENINQYLIEEYIPGTTHSIDGVIQNKKIHTLGDSTIKMGAEPYFFQETCFIPSDLSSKRLKMLHKFVERVIKALDFDNCGFHCEIRLNKGKPYLLEIAARCPGGLLPLQYKEVYGINLVHLAARIALGENIDHLIINTKKRKLFSAFPRISTLEEGKLISINEIKNLSYNSYIKRIIKFYNLEENIYSANFPKAIIGFLVVTDNKASLNTILTVIKRSVSFNIKPFNNLSFSPYGFLRTLSKFLKKFSALIFHTSIVVIFFSRNLPLFLISPFVR